MLENGKITSYQLALIIYPTIFATAILTVPNISHSYAGRDMWISPIIGSLNGFLTAYILYQLHKMYPNETIFEYSQHIIGKFPSKVLTCLYVFFFLYMSGFILREYADFIIITFLPETPRVVIMGSLVLVSAFAVSGGVSVLGRASSLFIPIFIIPIPFIMLILFQDYDTTRIFPILENGLKPPLLGAAVPQAWFSEVFIIAILLPFLRDRKQGMKWIIISIIAIMLSLICLNLTALFLFGDLTSYYTFPVFKAIRYISFMNFFEHLEAAIIPGWMLGAYIKLTVFFYILVVGTAQCLNLPSYKPLILPLGFLVTLFGFWEFYNLQGQTEFTRTVFPFLLPFMLTLLPVLLLVIAKLKRRLYQKKEVPNGSSSLTKN
ncbi:endospore germination permease [Peribacillus sp. NPDC097225]|uniref:GerAB/ArcD/ProY family transporter n=1 Tax=Peribacillus sp. NPDC097225 TaxID=3364400 RepID=UPI00380B1FA6